MPTVSTDVVLKRFVAAILGLASTGSVVFAQTPEPPTTPDPPPVAVPSPSTAATATQAFPTTLEGTLVGREETANRITLQRASDRTQVVLFLGLQTRYIRHKQEVRLADFTLGEGVVAKVTYGGAARGIVFLRELWDAESYADNQSFRTKICTGKVARFLSDAVEVIESPTGILRTFRVTGKTTIVKGGRSASPADYPAGAAIAVKPRGLPSGGVMAHVIAENAAAVEQTYLDSLSRWTGTIRSIDRTSRTLSLLRTDSSARTVQIAPTASIYVNRKKTDISELKAGQTATLSLTKESASQTVRVCSRVSVGPIKAEPVPFPGATKPPVP